MSGGLVMPKFGKTSRSRLETCHKALVCSAEAAIEIVDFSIVWGHRGEEDQNKAYYSGHSNVKWPNSKHNKIPSEAFDFMPYPFKSWEDIKRFTYIAGIIMGCALQLGVILTYGGDWKKNGMLKQIHPYDYGHIEFCKYI